MCLWTYFFGPKNNTPAIEEFDPPPVNTIRIQPGGNYQSTGTHPPSRATIDFEENLRKRQPVLKPLPNNEQAREVPALPTRPPVVALENYTNSVEINRQQKEFEDQLNHAKRTNEQKENQMRIEKAENDQRTDLLFQQAFEKQKEQNEEEYRRVQDEIDDYEKATQRLLKDRINEWKANQAMFLQCILLQQQFESQEREWSKWLETVSDSISSAKTRYGLFEKILCNLDSTATSYNKIFMNELMALHKATLASYDTVHEAFCTVKGLAEQVPDRLFLRILQKSLALASNKLCNGLGAIDNIMKNQGSTDQLAQAFKEISPRDIPTTLQLQEQSKRARTEDFLDMKNPKIYRNEHTVGIVEVREESFF